MNRWKQRLRAILATVPFVRPWIAPRRLRIDHRLSVAEFLRELEARRIDYVVLRWFEDLPSVAPGEDIDILIADDAVPRLEGLVVRTRSRKGVACDVYSVSGMPGFDYRGMAYYPPRLARQVLDRAVAHPSGARIPCAEDHFLSLAYHAVYHKGLTSGLPLDDATPAPPGSPEHDYLGTLTRLAAAAGFAGSITLRHLHQEIARRDLQPSADKLARLGATNLFCRDLAEAAWQSVPKIPGLAAFVIRDRASDGESLRQIRELLEKEGFELLHEQTLDGPGRQRVRDSIRGGNWAPGPWPTSGGDPAVMIGAFDLFPLPPDASLRHEYPMLDNARIVVAKNGIRSWYNQNCAEARRCNVVHSSDDARHAYHYLAVGAPDALDEIVARARKRLDDVSAHAEPVLQSLTRFGRRARVELICRPNGELAVRKTFRPQARRFFERELSALRELAAIDEYGVIPPVLEVHECGFVLPYYQNQLEKPGRNLLPGFHLPLRLARTACRAVEGFHRHGYEFLDFNPQNLLYDQRAGLKLIDFEFVRKRPSAAGVPFLESVTIRGPGEGEAHDRPVGEGPGCGAYDRHWKQAIALSPVDLLARPLWLNFLLRIPAALVLSGRRAAARIARVVPMIPPPLIRTRTR